MTFVCMDFNKVSFIGYDNCIEAMISWHQLREYCLHVPTDLHHESKTEIFALLAAVIATANDSSTYHRRRRRHCHRRCRRRRRRHRPRRRRRNKKYK